MKPSHHLLYALCALLLAWSAPAYAQEDPRREVDSIVKVILADTAAFRLLPTDASIEWPMELRARTKHEKAVAGLAKGILLRQRSEFDSSAKVLDGVIDLLSGTSDQRLLATAYLTRGELELGRNNIAGGIVQFERALQITAVEPYPSLDATLEKDIAWSYSQLNDHSQAQAHYHKALSLPMTPHDRYWTLGSLAEIETYVSLFSDALLHIQQMAALGDSIGASTATVDLEYGELAFAQGQYTEAADHFKSALARYEADSRFIFQAYTLSRLSNTYRLAGKTALAVEYARDGLQLSIRKATPKETLDNEKQLYQAYAAAGNKSTAFDHYQRYITLRDSTIGAVATGIMASSMLRTQMARQARTDSLLRAEKDLRRTEKHKAEMQRERTQRNIFLFAGLALACFTAVALRQRAKIKKERDRSDELLLNILPEEIAEELKEKGASEARQIDQVTVLFTDFKGFTSLSEQLSPQELVGEINTCFRAFDEILSKRGVEKIKTIGDAYMAAGGMPIPSADSARGTVLAALDMQEFMRTYKAAREALGKPAFEMRVGIHSGPVVAGIVGVKKFQYDIWGDTVNTASRMESSGEVGRVNISEATYALVKDSVVSAPLPVGSEEGGSRTTDNQQPATHAFTFTPRGKVQAKGKGEMEMYFVRRSLGEG